MSYFLYKGQISPALLYTITQSNGTPVDLTGKTVAISTRMAGSSQLIVDHRPVTIVAPPTSGVIEYDPITGDTDRAGTVLAFCTVTSGGTPEDTPEFSFPIYSHTVPWCAPGDVARVAKVTVPTDAADLIDAALAGSDVMNTLLARQFRGIRQDTIRPTRRGCGCWTGLGSFFARMPFSWGLWGLGWGWGYQDIPEPLGCGVLQQYELSYPVQSIVSVKLDGATVDPTTYRVDEQRFLVRTQATPDTPNPGWPWCQNLALPDTQPGTWSVTYTWGEPPPRIAVLAAEQVAAQLYLSLVGQACSLPTGTTKITRQGVQIDRGLLASFLTGSTGLPLVDAAIAALNPNRLYVPSAVYSPDLPKFGRHVGG